MRHLWPGPCGSEGGSPAGGIQTKGTTVGGCRVSASEEPTVSILKVLTRLSGVITSEGLPAQTSTVTLSLPGGSTQLLPSGLRRTLTLMSFGSPGSALSGPDVGPVSCMSGLSHQTPFVEWLPPSPAT